MTTFEPLYTTQIIFLLGLLGSPLTYRLKVYHCLRDFLYFQSPSNVALVLFYLVK